MINPLLNQRIRAAVGAAGDGTFYGLDTFFGNQAGGI
jgi:hypothetical protein